MGLITGRDQSARSAGGTRGGTRLILVPCPAQSWRLRISSAPMRLPTGEFIRRFLTHVLPSGFHRIRHAGFLANGIRRDRIGMIRHLLDVAPRPGPAPNEGGSEDPDDATAGKTCPECGGAMIIIKTFTRGQAPKSRAPPWEDAA